jgi:hypothetical protein
MKKVYIVAIAGLFAVHLVMGVLTIRANSPTYDEHVHLTAGYSYLRTGNYYMNVLDHPPFAEMWAALPLLSMNLTFPSSHPYWEEIFKYQYAFADIFMYKNRVDAEKMLNSARMMILLFSLALGALIYMWTSQLYGRDAGIIALALWAFSSTFLAHGTVVTTDMALTLFYFMSMYAFWRFIKGLELKKPKVANTVLLGLSLGLLLASKYSSFIIFGVIGIIAFWYVYTKKIDSEKLVFPAIACFVVIFFVLEFVFQFNPLGTYYWLGMKKVLSGVATGRSSFLMGRHSVTGWLYYFPVAFLIKTPIPMLVLLASIVFARKMWNRENLLFLALPAAVYFAAGCYAKVNIGHRHIMPVYPLLMVLAGGCGAELFKGRLKYVLAALLVWYAASAIRVHPWHLSYFNEFIGGPKNSYKYMTDSNVDWGNGLKELGKYLKGQGVSGVYMCYFGTGDPHYYGIKYRQIGFIDNISYQYSDGLRKDDDIDFSKEKKVLFCVSETNLQATYYADKDVFSWMKSVPPEKIVANSIFVYDLTKYPDKYKMFKMTFGIKT